MASTFSNIDDPTQLDTAKVVSITNRAQAICLLLSEDALVPEVCRKHYEEANESMKKAMRSLPHKPFEWN